MKILVTGITGAIGASLAPRLLADGHEVRGLSRRQPPPTESVGAPEIELLTGDAVSGLGLREALRGIDVAYYLIHSMEPESGPRFHARESAAATNFARAAARAGVGRVVYLGGLVPEHAAGPSAHLSSRLEVERILTETAPDPVALRASIVIGARSRSFRFLVRLVERMPVLFIPAWREYRTAPVDERDVIECLVGAADDPALSARSLDIAGPEVVSYGRLIERIRDLMMLERPVLNLPGLTATPIASRISALIAGEQHALIGPLMAGLASDLLPREPLATELLAVRRHSLDAAIEHALAVWERTEPLRAR
jgi:uncharacterized protein YbjT (DUF2867 family)